MATTCWAGHDIKPGEGRVVLTIMAYKGETAF